MVYKPSHNRLVEGSSPSGPTIFSSINFAYLVNLLIPASTGCQRSAWHDAVAVFEIGWSVRGLCSSCGSPMLFRPVNKDWISILSGTLDDP